MLLLFFFQTFEIGFIFFHLREFLIKKNIVFMNNYPRHGYTSFLKMIIF